MEFSGGAARRTGSRVSLTFLGFMEDVSLFFSFGFIEGVSLFFLLGFMEGVSFSFFGLQSGLFLSFDWLQL